MPHPKLDELKSAAADVARLVAVVRAPDHDELCECRRPAALVFVTATEQLPYCGVIDVPD